MEEEPAFEPTADDLATLTLDLLMAEAGYERFGVNPLLVPGRE
jgi:FdhE protein